MYIEVLIEVRPFSEENVDIVIAELEECAGAKEGVTGFESYVSEEPFLKAYIPQEDFSEQNLKTVLSAFDTLTEDSEEGDIALRYSLEYIHEKNWNAVWEESFEPVVIGGLCTIKARFHKGLARTKYTIIIDPKMAFGTGHHQTTSLMVEALLRENGNMPPILDETESSGSISEPLKGRKKVGKIGGKQLLDMGCGTGILSILAAKMKAKNPVHAIDIDHIAVQSSLENAYVNRVHDKVHTLCGDASLIQAGKYDIILANINRNILLQDISTYSRGLSADGMLFISGFYKSDIHLLVTEGERHSLKFAGSLDKEEWAMVKFKKIVL